MSMDSGFDASGLTNNPVPAAPSDEHSTELSGGQGTDLNTDPSSLLNTPNLGADQGFQNTPTSVLEARRQVLKQKDNRSLMVFSVIGVFAVILVVALRYPLWLDSYSDIRFPLARAALGSCAVLGYGMLFTFWPFPWRREKKAIDSELAEREMAKLKTRQADPGEKLVTQAEVTAQIQAAVDAALEARDNPTPNP
jgi:hypothetical protein